MYNYLAEDYTQEQFTRIYPEIKETVTAGIQPENRKCTIILGGQPGSGKSSFYERRDDLLDYAAINGDEYRRFHPMIQDILRTDPEHYAERTQGFANQVTETLISDLGNAGYNLIIEGTLRNPQVPIDTCLSLQEKGYQTELIVIACDAEIAWKATLARAEMQKEYGQIPRLVPLDVYNYTVHQIPHSLEIIQNKGCFNKITIQTRDAQRLFSAEKGDDNQRASDILRKELNLPGWDARYKDYEKDFIQRKIDILSDQMHDLERDSHAEQ